MSGRVGILRGSVIETSEGDEVMQTRSPHVADVIAQILNGDDVPRREVTTRSPLARYEVARDPGFGGYVIVAESTARRPGAFGYGIMAATPDQRLAEEIANALNDIDPLPKARVMRGAGWW